MPGDARGAHQDGIQAMGGMRITFRNLEFNCNSARTRDLLQLRQRRRPDRRRLRGLLLGPARGDQLNGHQCLRSGARNTLDCPGRYSTIRIGPAHRTR